MNFSMLCEIESSFKTFFQQVAQAIHFEGLLAIALVMELFFVFIFALKTGFSYEMRLRRSLDKLNSWLFINKKIDQNNIKEFNELVKKGPKRLQYYWQQYILFREKEPTHYLSLENLVEKPLKTSGWANNIKNLNLVSIIWALIVLLFGMGSITSLTGLNLISALALPVFVIIISIVASMVLKGRKTTNLDDIYSHYHIFARFILNACVDLPSYIDFDLLFSTKEISKGNPQLREYYESRARKAKEEFENAKQSDIEYVEYNFTDAGVDGSLVLERAMKETESFINKKTSTLSKISQVEAQKESLRRNHENVQKDLQRKIQASKENINKLIQQQEATTNRMEVGFLRKQQEQEISKQESLQSEYDQEETRFALSIEELNQEVDNLRIQLDDSKEAVQKAMVSEYQSFYEKVMRSAQSQAERKVAQEKSELIKQRDNNEQELIVVQTQIKRLVDENNTLRARLGDEIVENTNDGVYDENGNFVYKDGSYHDPNGLFHDVDGKVYDMNGTLIDEPKEQAQIEEEKRLDDVVAFGSYIDSNGAEKIIEKQEELPVEESPEQEVTTAEIPQVEKVEEKPKGKRGRPKKEVKEEPVKEAKKRGRPRKPEDEKVNEKPKKPVGRPRKVQIQEKKEDNDQVSTLASLEKINDMISEEENKLSKMKMLISSEIDEAMETSQNEAIAKETDKIMKEIENLQLQAQKVKEQSSPDELANINNRIEDLIKEISSLNK